MSYKTGDIITVTRKLYANLINNYTVYFTNDAEDASDWLKFGETKGTSLSPGRIPIDSLGDPWTAIGGNTLTCEENLRYGTVEFVAPVDCRLVSMAAAFYFSDPEITSDGATIAAVKAVFADGDLGSGVVTLVPLGYVNSDTIANNTATNDAQIHGNVAHFETSAGNVYAGEPVGFCIQSNPESTGNDNCEDTRVIVTALFETL